MKATEYRHSIKGVREQFKARGVFYTDEKLAHILKGYMPTDAVEVYDPTCGNGNLLAVFPDHVAKYGQEIDPEQAAIASQRLTNATIATGDTLEASAFHGKQYRAIVANPPFSIAWIPPALPDERFSVAPCLPPPSKADYAFLLHILHHLAPDGVAAVLNFPGVLYRGNKEGQLRAWLIERNVIDEVVHVEGGYFEDTKIPTALIILRKDRAEGAPVKFSNLQDGKSIAVSRDEIRLNGHTLNVSTYLQEEQPEREEIDPDELNEEARSSAIQVLRAHLEFTALTEGLFGHGSLAATLDEVQELINEYRTKTTRIDV